MQQWQAGHIAANGIRLHYTRTGASPTPHGSPAKPPIVLAHGVTDDGLCWTPVAVALEPEYDVIMLDARGHGRSDAPEHGYGPAQQADDLAGLIRSLHLHRPAIVGHSMGAATTLVLAGTYPELPGAIVLEDPPGWWIAAPLERQPTGQDNAADAGVAATVFGRDREREEHQTGMQAWFAGLKRKSRQILIAEQRAAAPGWSEAELGPWADAKLRVSPHVLEVFDAGPQAPVDWPATLRRIGCPALLITADAERGAILNGDDAAALQAAVPHLRIAHIAGAGHNVRREQFDRFLAVVQAFLGETMGDQSRARSF